MQIDKLISFHIENQFPAIYRESGSELVEFIKEYYKFLEETDTQSLYNGRRIFEYRDIDTTLNRMLLFFKNKYLADLPFDDNTIRIIVKNIIDLYRRKGTPDGLKLFFRLFFDSEIKIYYPAKDILKPSDSVWRQGTYLQLKPNSGLFTSTETDQIFTYNDIVGKTIVGTTTGAVATVNKINFITINETLVPIISISDVSRSFIGLESILCKVNDIIVDFGIINGSFSSIKIDQAFKGTTGNSVGDLVTFVTNTEGIGARGIVTQVTENFTGIVNYSVLDGGWGYSIGSTQLLVSNQIIFVENENGFLSPYQDIKDDFGNTGIIIGKNNVSVGIKADDGSEFTSNSSIYTVGGNVLQSVGISANRSLMTSLSEAILLAANGIEPEKGLFEVLIDGSRMLGDLDGSGTITSADSNIMQTYVAGGSLSLEIRNYIEGKFAEYILANKDDYFQYPAIKLEYSSAIAVVPKNESSPGALYADTGNLSDIKVASLSNTETVSLIFDVIGNYLDVTLDATNYNAAPALIPMSGNTDPISIGTDINVAFDLEPIEIGTINNFENINPGSDYVNDVFAIAYDKKLALFSRKNQKITLTNIPPAINVGNIITQNGKQGKVVSIVNRTLTIIPFTYDGFNSTDPILFGGNSFDISSIETDFSSPISGFNANIDSVTDFAVGRIVGVNTIESGYGYVHNSIVDVIDSNNKLAARGKIFARGQGFTGGYWETLNSHLNGYVQTGNNSEYFNSGKYVQDSEYYQEYSYEIQSKLNLESYEQSLKDITHVAGSKVFAKFNMEETVSTPVKISINFEF